MGDPNDPTLEEDLGDIIEAWLHEGMAENLDLDEPEPATDHAADEADVDEGHVDIDGVYVPGLMRRACLTATTTVTITRRQTSRTGMRIAVAC